jgi:hypothetical protein
MQRLCLGRNPDRDCCRPRTVHCRPSQGAPRGAESWRQSQLAEYVDRGAARGIQCRPRSLCGRDGHHGAAQGTTCRRQPRSVRHEDHGTAGGAQRRQRPLSEWYEHHGAAQRADGRREDCWWSEAAARKCLRGGRAGIAIFSCPIHVNLVAPLYPGFWGDAETYR